MFWATEFTLTLYCLLDNEVDDAMDWGGRLPGSDSWISCVQAGSTFGKLLKLSGSWGSSFVNRKDMSGFFHNFDHMITWNITCKLLNATLGM